MGRWGRGALAALALGLATGVAGAGDGVRTVLEVWEFPRIADPADPSDRYSWFRELIAGFEAAHPGIEVRLTELTWRSGTDKLKVALFAGCGPDVVSGVLEAGLLESGAYDPIDPHLGPEDRADYRPEALAGMSWAGRTWGWPWCQKGELLFLSAEVFRRAGLAFPPGGRFDAAGFEATLAALAAARERTGAYPLGMSLVPAQPAELGLILPRDLPLLGSDGNVVFKGPRAEASLGRLERWLREGVLPPASPGWLAKDLWLAFTRDKSVAMAPLGLWALKALQKLGVPFGLAALPPAVDGPGFAPVSTVGYFVLARPGRSPEATAAAHRFARWVTRGEAQQILARYGQFPTRRSAGELFGDDPPMAQAGRLIEGGTPFPAHRAWEAAEEALKRGTQAYLLEHYDAPRALATIEAVVQARLARRDGTAEAPGWARWSALALGAGLALGLARVLVGMGGSASVLAAPALVLLGLFLVIPGLQGLAMAFTRPGPGTGLLEGWVGVENFRRAFGDASVAQAARNTLVYAMVVVPGNLLAGLVLAALIHPLSKAVKGWFRGAFYLPGVISVVALAMVWRQVLDERTGLLNRLFPADSAGGGLLRALLPCLERVPTAIGGWFLVAAVVAFGVRLVLGSERPQARRMARDRLLVVAALGAAGYVLASAGAKAAGSGPVGWLTTPELSFWSVILMTLVRGPGGALLVYLAALEALDPELFDAAEVDGAGRFQQLYHITLPALVPTTRLLAMSGVIDSFQAFGQVFLLTEGGPGYSSTVVVHRMYLAGFRDLDFGLAAAQGVLLLAAVAAVGAAERATREPGR